MISINVNVKFFRSLGFEAKWGRTFHGAPAMFLRLPSSSLEHQKTTWWMLTKSMYADMTKVGAIEGFCRHTLLGDLFSVKA